MKPVAYKKLALGISAWLGLWSPAAPAEMTLLPGLEFRLEKSIVLEPPEVAGNRVGLRWSRSANAAFLAYLVCRTTNDVVRPSDCIQEYLAYDQTAYVDTVPSPGVYRYRIYEVIYSSELAAFVWIGSSEQAATVYWGDLPDFQITQLSLAPSNPAPQQAMTAYLTITNSGTAAGEIGQVSVWVRDSWLFASSDGCVTGGVLQAGQGTNLVIGPLTAPSCGTNTLLAVVDSASGTFETNENNNTATLDYVIAADTYPDFAVTEIVLTPPRPARGGTFSALVTVENRGTLGADGGCLDVWAHRFTNAVFGEMGDISTNIGFLSPAQSRSFLFSGLIAPTGGAAGVFRVFADSQGDTADCNGDYNQVVRCYGLSGTGVTHYVRLDCTNPVPPYTNWTTAATNIQDAVEAAADGDLVAVMDGIYSFPIGEITVADGITVRSLHGSEDTIVDGQHLTRCFHLNHPNAILDGFTIRNGSAGDPGGGGVLVSAGTVQNCFFTNNSAGGSYGGGARVDAGGTVQDCTFVGNGAYYGGGVACISGRVQNCTISGSDGTYGTGAYCWDGTIQHCTIKDNVLPTGGRYGSVYVGGNAGLVRDCLIISNVMLHASTYGGGAYCEQGGAVEDCDIRDNRADERGGGVFCEDGGRAQKCLIQGNRSTHGGGVYCISSGIVQQCVVSGNSATNGGGVYCDTYVTPGGNVWNCLITSNLAERFGGGLYHVLGNIRNCTMSGNTAGEAGGGVYSAWPSNGTIRNAIVYFNSAPAGANYAGSNDVFSFSCTTPAADGEGNITNDPQFVGAPSGNFHLAAGSACIDAGTWDDVPPFDLDGVGRPLDGDANGSAVVDMGACEYVHALTDTDGDGLADTNEVARGTNPAKPDTDDDGSNDGHEILAGTNPLDPFSVLELTGITWRPFGHLEIRWSSVTGRVYAVTIATNLLATNLTEAFVILTNQIPATPSGENVYTDSVPLPARQIYRIELE